jgi:hypothetical protein
MTTHVQGGAIFASSNGKRTKSQLKEAIKNDPAEVELYSTSSMGPQFHNAADQLPEDTEFLVVGPDPYTKRDWYASIKRGIRGKLVVT